MATTVAYTYVATYNLVQMVDLKVKNKDFTDNFASCISCHDLFDYNADDINRLRSQMHDLIVHVTSLYRNHRDTVIDCLNESDDEDDEDDVEIMYPVTQTSRLSLNWMMMTTTCPLIRQVSFVIKYDLYTTFGKIVH